MQLFDIALSFGIFLMVCLAMSGLLCMATVALSHLEVSTHAVAPKRRANRGA